MILTDNEKTTILNCLNAVAKGMDLSDEKAFLHLLGIKNKLEADMTVSPVEVSPQEPED